MSDATLRTILAALLLIHGVGHFMGVIPALRLFGVGSGSGPSWRKKWSSRSWLLRGFLSESKMRIVCAGLFLAATAGFIGSGLGLLGWLIPFQAWRFLALASSLISLLAVFLYWNAFILLFPHKLGAIAVNILMVFGIMMAASAGGGPPIPFNIVDQAKRGSEIGFELTSPAFVHEGAMPALYTCEGEELSPPLEWTDPPFETRSFALIMEDLDTPIGNITHWVLYNIPAGKRMLESGIPAGASLPGGVVQGRNGIRRNQYAGPCPPSGTHRYVIHLFALDVNLPLEPKWGKKHLLKAMQDHILAAAHLMGTYQKQ